MILNDTDREILKSYSLMIEGLSSYIGGAYEIVLHSLENLNYSAIKVLNGHHSNRKEGAPITDLALSYLEKINNAEGNQNFIYTNRSSAGADLLSTTIPIYSSGRVIGLICINFNMETPLSDILARLSQPFSKNKAESETFASDPTELINSSIQKIKAEVFKDATIHSINKNKEIIARMHNKGLFEMKDSVIIVASELQISKNTVYMHIRNLGKK